MKVKLFMFNDCVYGSCSFRTSLLNHRVHGICSLWTSISAEHVHGNHHFAFISLGVYHPYHLFMLVIVFNTFFHGKKIILAEG
jgi:hypothetical protein